MVGFDFYELVHKKDVSMVKTQLYTTSSDMKEEKLDVKKSSMLKEEIDGSDNICPGAKRSFLCRMKKGAMADDVKNIGTKISSRKTKTNVLLDEKDLILSEIFFFFVSFCLLLFLLIIYMVCCSIFGKHETPFLFNATSN